MVWGLKEGTGELLRVPRCHFQANKWPPVRFMQRSIFAVKVASKWATVTV